MKCVGRPKGDMKPLTTAKPYLRRARKSPTIDKNGEKLITVSGQLFLLKAGWGFEDVINAVWGWKRIF